MATDSISREHWTAIPAHAAARGDGIMWNGRYFGSIDRMYQADGRITFAIYDCHLGWVFPSLSAADTVLVYTPTFVTQGRTAELRVSYPRAEAS
jgi:hypothetical protein